MSELSIVAATRPGRDSPARVADDPAKITDAAHQFEALLLTQILRSERESGNGWLGSGGDIASSCAIDFAEQQFGMLLSQHGGLGLAGLIASGLKSHP